MRMTRMFGHTALGLLFATVMAVAPLRAADTVTIGTVGSPSANLWPVFIGIDKGFFTAQNLKADVVYIQSSASVIQQLSAGSLDMSMSTGLVDPIRAIDQGAAIALTRFEVQAPPYALLAKSSIKSLKDLKGKVISVGGPKDITRLYVERMLAPQGLKTGDYDFVYAGATSARAQALLSGAVDAAILLPPSNFQVQNAGYNDLGLAMQYAPELAFSGTVVNKAWAARDANWSSGCSPPRARAPTISTTAEPRRGGSHSGGGQRPEAGRRREILRLFHQARFLRPYREDLRLKMNALIDTLVGLGDVQTRGNIERFLLPGVAELSD